MTCPKCRAALPRAAIAFASPRHTVHCGSCGATLAVSFASRVLLLFLAFVAATAAAQGLRAAGLGDLVAVGGLVASFLGVYWVGAGLVARVREVPDDPSKLG